LYIDHDEGSCYRGFDRGSNLRQHRLHERPQAVAKDDDRNPATFEVLLKTDVFVGCKQHVKPGLFRDTQ